MIYVDTAKLDTSIMYALFWIVIAGLPALLLAQPDCADLGFTNVQPSPGETTSVDMYLAKCTEAIPVHPCGGAIIMSQARARKFGGIFLLYLACGIHGALFGQNNDVWGVERM